MGHAEITAKMSYWVGDRDSAEYERVADVVTIMRDGGESVIEIMVVPDAHPKLKDRLYIRVEAKELMSALTSVLMGQSTHSDDT